MPVESSLGTRLESSTDGLATKGDYNNICMTLTSGTGCYSAHFSGEISQFTICYLGHT